MPTFDAFGPDGSLYVGDANEPVIWRVPPGGGQAAPWFTDPRIFGGGYGSNVDGIAIEPGGRSMLFAAGSRGRITVYRLPLAHPDAAHLSVFHTYTDVEPVPCAVDPSGAGDPNTALILANCYGTQASAGAGGLAIGKSGRVYVALLMLNQLSILGPTGNEIVRFPDSEANMDLPVPVNGPLGVGLDRSGELLVANVGDPSLGYGPGGQPPQGGVADSKTWAVLASQVHDTPAPLFRPTIR